MGLVEKGRKPEDDFDVDFSGNKNKKNSGKLSAATLAENEKLHHHNRPEKHKSNLDQQQNQPSFSLYPSQIVPALPSQSSPNNKKDNTKKSHHHHGKDKDNKEKERKRKAEK